MYSIQYLSSTNVLQKALLIQIYANPPCPLSWLISYWSSLNLWTEIDSKARAFYWLTFRLSLDYLLSLTGNKATIAFNLRASTWFIGNLSVPSSSYELLLMSISTASRCNDQLLLFLLCQSVASGDGKWRQSISFNKLSCNSVSLQV